MRGRGKEERAITVAGIGLALGTATAAIGVALWRRGWLGRLRPPGWAKLRHRHEMGSLEQRVLAVLEEDADLSHRAIGVAAIAGGIIELTGRVATEEEAARAVGLAGEVAGVRTVLNRLDSAALEDHLEVTRRRMSEGDPSLAETQWSGQGVGMGRRRQSRWTDPPRPDDRADILSRELGAHRAVELTSERLDKIPSGVPGHTTGPAGPIDRGQIGNAPHRRLGNVPEQGPQDLNPASGVHHPEKKAERSRLDGVDVTE
jgi:hypothetical protein